MTTSTHNEEYKGYTIKLILEEFPTKFKINSGIGKIVDDIFFLDKNFKPSDMEFHKTDGMLNALMEIVEARKVDIDQYLA